MSRTYIAKNKNTFSKKLSQKHISENCRSHQAIQKFKTASHLERPGRAYHKKHSNAIDEPEHISQSRKQQETYEIPEELIRNRDITKIIERNFRRDKTYTSRNGGNPTITHITTQKEEQNHTLKRPGRAYPIYHEHMLPDENLRNPERIDPKLRHYHNNQAELQKGHIRQEAITCSKQRRPPHIVKI